MVNYYTTIQSILNYTRMFFDILIMWLLLYYTIKIVRNNSRTIQIFKGIVLILVIKAVANIFGLNTVGWIADMFVSWGFIAVIIIFQPEIRSLLEKLGKSNVFSRISTLSGNEKEHLVDELVKAVMILSKDQTGALISLEQSHSLNDYVKTGTPMNSMVTAELLTSIFVTSTPLHDGAVIIQGDRLACASAYFPPTNQELPSRYGARHRAAIGISEITDSVTIVVSEETGNISIAEGGQITTVSKKELRDYLLRVVCNEETVVREKTPKTQTRKSYFVIDEPQLVVEKEIETKKSEKGLLNKIAVKKQDGGESGEAEKKNAEHKGNLFSGIFNKKKDAEVPADRLSELEKEEENIKLPKKKKKKAPSSSMFEDPEILEQQIAAQEAEKKAQADAEIKTEAASEEPVQAAVTEVLEIKTAQSEDEARAKKKPRAKKPKDAEESVENKAKRTRKKAEEKASEDKEAAAREIAEMENAGKENPEVKVNTTTTADITAENQNHSPIDDVKLEFSASEEVNEHSLEEAVNSADQEGSDKHEE